MRTLGWLALALIFAATSVLLVAWPDLEQLRRSRIWAAPQTDGTEAELHGVRVFIDEARAAILPEMEDRALIYLRLGLQGDPDTLKGWQRCDIGLTDAQGRVWRPLLNQAGLAIIDMLGADRETDYRCDQSLFMADTADSPSFSVQAFLVPVTLLNDLRLEFSGTTIRPDAVSLPFRPVLRPTPR